MYKITKRGSCRQRQETHPWLKEIALNYAVQDGGMRLHSAALRYYDEVGVDIREASR